MARLFINQLKEGSPVEAVFLAKRKKLDTFRNKPGQYLSLTLADRTGEVEAKVWENAEAIAATFEEGGLVRVKAFVESFNDRLQLRCVGLWPVPLEEADLADFLPASPRPLEEMQAELEQTIESVAEPHLRALLDRVLTPEVRAVMGRAPGAIRIHHAYLGGLLEHTLNVVRLLEELCRIYPAVDRDLVITGCLLHDIGKLQEYRYDTVLDYAPHGRLLGHVVIGATIVHRALEELPDFPPELAARLWHMVISHHGTRDFGAPVLPATPEAIALHYAENLEAHVNQVLTQIEQSRQHNPDRAWTDFVKPLERYLYVGRPEDDDDGDDDPPAGQLSLGQ